MACRLASPACGNSHLYLGIIGIWFLCMACRLASPGPGECFATWPHQYLVTQVPKWASFGPVESGPYLVVTRNWSVCSPSGNNLDLVNLFPICASPIPGDFFPHLDLFAVDSFLASPGTGDSEPICASPRSGDSGPHLWTIMIWILCSTPETHLDMMTLDPLWTSP